MVTCVISVCTHHTQMGYGSRALDLLGKYYEGDVPSLSEGQLHVDPITSIDPDQVRMILYLVPTPYCPVCVKYKY